MNRTSVMSLIYECEEDINRSDYKRAILAVYVKCGADGLKELKSIPVAAGLDIRDYNRACAALIGTPQQTAT